MGDFWFDTFLIIIDCSCVLRIIYEAVFFAVCSFPTKFDEGCRGQAELENVTNIFMCFLKTNKVKSQLIRIILQAHQKFCYFTQQFFTRIHMKPINVNILFLLFAPVLKI